jgi:hypothetical protein
MPGGCARLGGLQQWLLWRPGARRHGHSAVLPTRLSLPEPASWTVAVERANLVRRWLD